MTPEEHFKDRPELLAEPLVQSLIEHMQAQFKVNAAKAQQAIIKGMDMEHRALALCINSEVFVMGGTPCREVVEAILGLHND